MLEGHTFKSRIEKKYRVKRSIVERLLDGNEDRLKNLLESDSFGLETVYTEVTNTYFDTACLKTYRESLDKKPNRYKLRVRSYAPNGIDEELVYFEMKNKAEGKSSKERIALKREWLEQFVSKGIIDVVELLKLNIAKESREVLTLLDKISSLLHEQAHIPCIEITYKRYSYKLKKSKKLRMTIDMDLAYRRLEVATAVECEYKKDIKANEVIVELKYKKEESLELAQEFVSQLGDPKGFSKYSYAVSQTSSQNADQELLSVVSDTSLMNARLEGRTLSEVLSYV